MALTLPTRYLNSIILKRISGNKKKGNLA